jgi:hypothetical protein
MRIDPKVFAPPLAATPRRAAGARAFSLDGQAQAARTGGAAAPVALASMDALLALQSETDPGERRRRSIQRGHDLLDALDRLKAALLSGRVPTTDLRTIAARIAERQDLTGDPRLDDILSHIELRAQVEMAKLAAR